VPDAKITLWPPLMRALRDTPGVRVVVLNHPRSIHSNFRPFGPENFDAATGENKRGGEFSFDAIEVLNSGAQQSDYMLVFRDWFALLNRGHRFTAVGASDSHDVSRFIVGQARTYIAAQDDNPGRIDVTAACESLLAGRALVSMGLLAQMTVEERFTVGDLATNLPEQVRVRVKVLGPSWAKADRVELFANGVRIPRSDGRPRARCRARREGGHHLDHPPSTARHASHRDRHRPRCHRAFLGNDPPLSTELSALGRSCYWSDKPHLAGCRWRWPFHTAGQLTVS
jgi:hypothetical protein